MKHSARAVVLQSLHAEAPVMSAFQSRRDAPRANILARAFDALAMGTFPLVATVLGYRVRVGATPELRADARDVLAQVWRAEGVSPSEDARWVEERYDAATTWVVVSHRGRPVGVVGVLDMRIACLSLDFEMRVPPPGMDLATTREVARLAILPSHQRGDQLVLVALLHQVLTLCRRAGVRTLMGGSTRNLFELYRRFNPAAQIIHPPAKTHEPPELTQYFAPLRAYSAGRGVLFTFDLGAASPWHVFSRLVKNRVRHLWRGFRRSQ
ncbi:MAG: hypothetical protein AB2A00_14245 [Myxococcota bacterium]